MMLKRASTVAMMVGALAMASTAHAAFIQGELDIAGNVAAVDSSGNPVAKNLATALDFLPFNSTTPTPGVAGQFGVTLALGDFATAGIVGLPVPTTGTIKDFTFSGLGNGNYPNAPLTQFQLISSPSFSFLLSSISITTQNSTAIGLQGLGTLFLTGFDPTPGEFQFTDQGTGTQGFSFSATDEVLPEPGSMVLLGTGLLGLGLLARRRWLSRPTV